MPASNAPAAAAGAAKSTKIGVVYDTTTLQPVRVISPDDDQELNDPLHIQNGEAMLTLVRKQFPLTDLPSVKAAVKAAAAIIRKGATPAPIRSAIIDSATNQVIAVVMARPDEISRPGAMVVADDQANVGDTYDPVAKTFTPPPAAPVTKTPH